MDNKTKQAMQMALEWFEWCLDDKPAPTISARGIAASLREALAQPQGEPVAWGVRTTDDYLIFQVQTHAEQFAEKWELRVDNLYTTPPSVEAAIEEKDHQIATLMCDIEEMYSREDVDHLIGVEREATKEKAAKVCESYIVEGIGREMAAAIRSMK